MSPKGKGQEPEKKKDEKVENAEEPKKPGLSKEKLEQLRKEEEKKQRELLEKRSKELELYLKDGISFETIRGKKIKCPPVRGKAEKKALKILISFIVTNPKLTSGFMGSQGLRLSPALIIQALTDDSAGDSAFEAISQITAVLLDKDPEWVDENLLAAEMLKVVRPFFLVEAKLLSQMMKPEAGETEEEEEEE